MPCKSMFAGFFFCQITALYPHCTLMDILPSSRIIEPLHPLGRILPHLIRVSGRKTYMVVTSTVQEQDSLIQIHHLVDSSLFMEMYRSITDYSKTLKQAGDHDAMTGAFQQPECTFSA